MHRDEQRLETALNELRGKYRKTRYRTEIDNAERALKILKAARSMYKSRCLSDVTVRVQAIKRFPLFERAVTRRE